MITSQRSEDFEQVIEKIVFNEEELEELKIAIRNFTEGNIKAKQLKQKLLKSRGRMVKDISHFLSFCIDRIKNENITSEDNQPAKKNQFKEPDIQLQQDIFEKNELLNIVANKVNNLVENLKKN